MDVRIGIINVNRELSVEVSQTPDEVAAKVDEALGGTSGVFSLTDTKGRRVLVPSAQLGYVEIGEPEARRVGFGI